ncbi:hypothetical protein [Soonwooa sp.]|uniref:hypothetical protein n=1 Tax=Soonwooa sp. TaxID=1938592 RepID=UPI002609D008|nr:hypothetical protein [Soonwooa sp.]
MKNYLHLLFLTAITVSCYSPKSDIEEDKHPDIPHFPSFKNNNIKLTKVAEWTATERNSIKFLSRGDYLYLFYSPEYLLNDRQDWKLLILKNDKILQKDSLKTNFTIQNLAFLDSKNNLYVNRFMYQYPDYKTKKEIPIFDLDVIAEKYDKQMHRGEQERDSAIFNQIHQEQKAFQDKMYSQIQDLTLVSNPSNSSVDLDNFSWGTFNYFCNLNSNEAFLLRDGFLSPISTEYTKYQPDQRNLLKELKPKMTLVPKKDMLQDNYYDTSSILKTEFKTAKDSIVTGNVWFSRGNHYVASFGYAPIYMKYYNLNLNGTKTETKIDHTKTGISHLIDTDLGTYLIMINKKENVGKYEVYFLPKK